MSRQRWGTFSVFDHLQSNPFVADVLLYDRLVIPYPPDATERERWKKNKRKVDRLDACLEELGGRAYKVLWDTAKKEAFKMEVESARATFQRISELKYVVESGGMTPQVLVDEIQMQAAGWGERRPFVMTAYPSTSRFMSDAGLKVKALGPGQFNVIFSHRFLVPQCGPKDEMKLLRDVVKLSSSEEFQGHRADFYHWQEEVVEKEDLTIREAISEMENLLRKLEKLTKRVTLKHYAKWAFTILGIGVGMASGEPITTVSAGKAGLEIAKAAV